MTMLPYDEQDLLGVALDTGQLDVLGLDTGQDTPTEALALPSDARLIVQRFEIHRTDQVPDGGEEEIISTLKFFQLEVALVDADDLPILDVDVGRVRAQLLYENGRMVEELSVSLEPPLLGGDAPMEGGRATFRLRITVLSSLCNSKRFRVHVALAARPDISVMTQAIKTITKLRRGARGAPSGAGAKAAAATADVDLAPLSRALPTSPTPAAGLGPGLGQKPASCAKRVLSASAEKGPNTKGAATSKEATAHATASATASATGKPAAAAAAHGGAAGGGERSLADLWEEVTSNGEKLLALQEQQRALFAELRRLREATGETAAEEQAAAAPVC